MSVFFLFVEQAHAQVAVTETGIYTVAEIIRGDREHPRIPGARKSGFPGATCTGNRLRARYDGTARLT